jgi:hypothetical protein
MCKAPIGLVNCLLHLPQSRLVRDGLPALVGQSVALQINVAVACAPSREAPRVGMSVGAPRPAGRRHRRHRHQLPPPAGAATVD